eukprot:CAMPEP_0181228304 /NCGR_PEP_ID=MMETSP1096-20121128/33277_1 /TAXON_ID=156174 ORGANISM="Chrysochromulina ericina, Strain CCMP281" /NCGR_SAMPLE_ID=MMETSP1096 /ASSEMBLY_ACC=CAM_ASM_000453 /LENGTH=72 /DNA_ID=CAMNT_0023321821 /DNA_START=654 /DNA_END=873 /DNA_ORIENTATION=+
MRPSATSAAADTSASPPSSQSDASSREEEDECMRRGTRPGSAMSASASASFRRAASTSRLDASTRGGSQNRR